MYQIRFNNTVLIVTLLLIFGVCCPAMDLECDLAIKVIEATENTPESDKPIDGISATARNLNGKKEHKIKNLNGVQVFPGLVEGLYLISVEKFGYKTTVRITKHSCQEKNLVATPETVRLWRGNYNEKINQIAENNDSIFRVLETSVSNPLLRSGTLTISLNPLAVKVPKLNYPPGAAGGKIGGKVTVQVEVGASGSVLRASAVAGHPLLRSAAEKFAMNTEFAKSYYGNTPAKLTGIVHYDFEYVYRETSRTGFMTVRF